MNFNWQFLKSWPNSHHFDSNLFDITVNAELVLLTQSAPMGCNQNLTYGLLYIWSCTALFLLHFSFHSLATDTHSYSLCLIQLRVLLVLDLFNKERNSESNDLCQLFLNSTLVISNSMEVQTLLLKLENDTTSSKVCVKD